MSDHPRYQAGGAWSQLLDVIQFIEGKTTDNWLGVSEGTWAEISRELERLAGFFELLPDPRARDLERLLRALAGVEFEYVEVESDDFDDLTFEREPLAGG
jgi:hypothetical protein